ncbi:MAG: hypothetical protein Tp176DCM1853251_75 [Prokaryotic dsDNA virus sp.]|nr:MAG: hypothetical protein Tp176DCM1853251_75 [Prokaryotic dsDNA virus sp.]|tara:strand:- start:951 stop:1214 length:264 start_codon:yes stop_codon:yes gene_type:complete
MHIKLHMGEETPAETHVSDSAAALVRYKFNPSGLADVQRIKFIAAALISECEALRDAKGPGAREAAIAITDIQKASMMAVAAATAHL